MPGRNEPCPCGSGKKFKHCHLVRAQPTTGITPEDRDAALDALARYAERDEFIDAVDLGILVWMGQAPHGDVDEAFADIDAHDTSYQAFWDWLYFDAPLPTGGTIASVFLQRRGRSLHPRAEDYIRLMSSTHLRPYQVREARPGEGLLVRDLWTNDDVRIAEMSGSRQAVVWDVLVARVHAHADGTRQLEGASLLLPPDAAPLMVKVLESESRRFERAEKDFAIERFFKMVAPVFHQAWYDRVATAPLPEMRTTEGDPLTTSTLVCDVPRAGEALVTRLGPLRLVHEEHTAADTPPRAGLRVPLVSDDVVDVSAVPELTDYRDAQDRAWLDLEIPALDGATPRAAAKNRRLRPRLVELLITIENTQARLALDGHARDVTWMWEELGVTRP